MISVTYRHNWSSELSKSEEMANLYGSMLVDYDTSEPYEQETSTLYVNNEGVYTWIDSNGCSCWEGDYDGWQLSKEELLKLAIKKSGEKWGDRDRAEDMVASWVLENIK